MLTLMLDQWFKNTQLVISYLFPHCSMEKNCGLDLSFLVTNLCVLNISMSICCVFSFLCLQHCYVFSF
jgi:hypothetical protein